MYNVVIPLSARVYIKLYVKIYNIANHLLYFLYKSFERVLNHSIHDNKIYMQLKYNLKMLLNIHVNKMN